MTLEQEALNYIRGLGQPWIRLLKTVADINLLSPTLKDDLLAERTIDRSQPGFRDFNPAASALIVPGNPAASLLYHTLASPLVKPNGLDSTSFPTIADLDLIENYILSLAPLSPSAIPGDSMIAVFAYEYRPSFATAHRRHADFVYSRTGISRVGEEPAIWDGGNRCWLNVMPGSAHFSVMPARYAAFLAVPRRRSAKEISVLGDPQPGDDSRIFLLPIRKLFSGPDCIAGSDLNVSFAEFHRREKLRRFFTESKLPKPPGLDKPPFLRDSTQSEKIVVTETAGASFLVSSKPEPLVRLARLPSGEIATFNVPPRRNLPLSSFAINRDNGSPSTFMNITAGLGITALEVFLQQFAEVSLRARNAPEFANMRHKPAGNPVELLDLSLDLGKGFGSTIAKGGYDAALFEDSIADGCVVASINGLPTTLSTKSAFSIIAAPKFFPYVNQSDLNDLVNDRHGRQDQFQNGAPKPLSLGRFPANLTLFEPGSTQAAFEPSDDTVAAVICKSYMPSIEPKDFETEKLNLLSQYTSTTFLSNGAAGVFEPGWDISFSEQNGVRFYASFGLGSPFPEDVKLCAADGAFWPAASPDAARTFNHGPTAIPMLDNELGYHVDHPRRIGPPSVGWDGEQGPFILGNEVNFASITRSDYVSHAFTDRTFSGAVFRDVGITELIARMDALRLCIQSLPEKPSEVNRTKLWLIYAEATDQAPPPAVGPTGPCYRFEFVIPSGTQKPSIETKRLLQPFIRRYVCYASDAGVSWAGSDTGPFTFVASSEQI